MRVLCTLVVSLFLLFSLSAVAVAQTVSATTVLSTGVSWTIPALFFPASRSPSAARP